MFIVFHAYDTSSRYLITLLANRHRPKIAIWQNISLAKIGLDDDDR